MWAVFLTSCEEEKPEQTEAQINVEKKREAQEIKGQQLLVAAKGGDIEAQYKLGGYFSSSVYSTFKTRDIKQAIYWYKIAAENGHWVAQLRLGTLYMNSDEIPHDYIKAKKWLLLADKQDKPGATNWLGYIYLKGGFGVKQNYSEAIKWFERTAKLGSFSGSYSLGEIYEKGEEVPQNNELAYFWYSIAVKQGDTFSFDEMTRLKKTLSKGELVQVKKAVEDWLEKYPTS